ncbi:hypothetical protein G6F56_007728 [Rhizopus delemar]|nr:hypothetical protein G6F56_007728 [Rhizopus delemar]
MSAHRYNVAEQQQIYREEIARIWKAQLDSLSITTEPELSDNEDERDMEQIDSPSASEHDWHRSGPSALSYNRNKFERGTPEIDDYDDDVSVTGSLSSNYHVNSQNKYLIIRRLITQKNGEKSWQQEVVRDSVNARMKKRIQDQLAKLKRNAERRRQRQLTKQAALAENPVLGLIRGKREGAMRRCGNCGQLGHMKTNKNCPNFYLMNDPTNNMTELPPMTDTVNTTTPTQSTPIVNEIEGL